MGFLAISKLKSPTVLVLVISDQLLFLTGL